MGQSHLGYAEKLRVFFLRCFLGGRWFVFGAWHGISFFFLGGGGGWIFSDFFPTKSLIC